MMAFRLSVSASIITQLLLLRHNLSEMKLQATTAHIFRSKNFSGLVMASNHFSVWASYLSPHLQLCHGQVVILLRT